eukprot:IDg5716t1
MPSTVTGISARLRLRKTICPQLTGTQRMWKAKERAIARFGKGEIQPNSTFARI